MGRSAFWDDRFRGQAFVYGEAPNVFLADHIDVFPVGARVLSLGEGEGRNAVFMAEQGLEVTGMDSSAEGLQKVERLAAARGVTVERELVDLTDAALGVGTWDGIINIYCHLPASVRQSLYGRIRNALKPGGVFLTEQFAKEQLGYQSGGPKDEGMLLSLEELQEAFHGDEVRLAEHTFTELSEGPLHQGRAAVVRFIVRKRG